MLTSEFWGLTSASNWRAFFIVAFLHWMCNLVDSLAVLSTDNPNASPHCAVHTSHVTGDCKNLKSYIMSCFNDISRIHTLTKTSYCLLFSPSEVCSVFGEGVFKILLAYNGLASTSFSRHIWLLYIIWFLVPSRLWMQWFATSFYSLFVPDRSCRLFPVQFRMSVNHVFLGLPLFLLLPTFSSRSCFWSPPLVVLALLPHWVVFTVFCTEM